MLFVPFALFDRAGYAAKARTRLEAMGYALDSLEGGAGDVGLIERAEAILQSPGPWARRADTCSAG